MPTAHEYADTLRARLSRNGEVIFPTDPISLAIEACAALLAGAEGTCGRARVEHAHFAVANLPKNSTAFERGLTLGLALALLTEPAHPETPAHLAACVDTIVRAAHAASASAGWWNDGKEGPPLLDQDCAPFVVATKLMLTVSELAEAMEGHRKGLMDDKLPHRPMIEVELADALHRLADLAGALKLDVGGALVEKMAFNAVRPDHKAEARSGYGGKRF